MNNATDIITSILKDVFGYSSFRGNQETIIRHVINGEDALVIMPTGGGKSLCYQIPALALDGLTIVISPLIALMEDQVISLRQNGVKASYLHSGISASEKQAVYSDLEEGKISLLYIAPETFVNERLIDYLRAKDIRLFAIDEAHCISVWGNDFRPEYTRLSVIREKFEQVPIIALTATADEATRADILDKLKISDTKLFLSSFERKNIIIQAEEGADRINKIERFLKKYQSDSGIIYCLSRKSTEDVAGKLKQRGFSAAYYHAGMDATSRSRIQKRFQNDEIRIICATIAFGMGIDKSNVRFVIHYNLPKNIESYYQEIGRAGRDGVESEALLFYSWADHIQLKSFIDDSSGSDTFKRVQESKLDRIWEFANAAACRSNMILSYFGEYKTEPCGHCDNCLSPPEMIDGTILTQKALSAIYRTNEKASIYQIIDILKGTAKEDITKHKWNNIKTFGVGRDLPYTHWRSYVLQMINHGLIKVDYTDHNRLIITPISKEVLSGDRTVKLVAYRPPSKTKRSRTTKKEIMQDELLTKLKNWRREKAQQINAPAYVIFNDATLQEIAKDKPIIAEDLLMIDGIGQIKREKYGDEIIELIRQYSLNQPHSPKLKGKTYLETLKLYKEGLTPDQIATMRKMNIITIYSHLAMLYEKGENIDINRYVSKEEIDTILAAAKSINEYDQLKEIHDALGGKMEYYKIRLSLAHHKRTS